MARYQNLKDYLQNEHIKLIDKAVTEHQNSDVDINGHINSIKYIEHILDLFPREKYEKQSIRRFEIAYKAESYMGDRLSFYVQPVDENETDVEVRKNESEVVCQAKICFR